jgi:hypothetical protein
MTERARQLAAGLVVVLALLLTLTAMLAPAEASAAPGTLTSPAAATTSFDPAKPFTWDAVTGASGYWLWVGTSPGANDVVNSGLLTRTSYTAKTLPPGRALYARLWTFKDGKQLPAADVTFQAVPALTSPSDGAREFDTTKPFTWTADAQAVGYALTIGTALGGKDVLDSGQLIASSYSAPALPTNRTLWARVTTRYSTGATATSDISFTAAPRYARLISPQGGAQTIDPAKPFTWDAVPGADGYWLWIGTSPGANDVVNSGLIDRTSYTPRTLPAGKTLYARLWTFHPSRQVPAPDVSFKAAPALTYPSNGAQDVDLAKLFTWTGDPQATGYQLTIGAAQGGSELYDSGQTTRTSADVPGLPAQRTLWARVTTQFAGGGTATTDVSFTAGVRPAKLTSHVNGGQSEPTRAFTWNPVPYADGYWLWIGTTPGGDDVVNSGSLTGTSYTAQNLPLGKTLYARLWTTSGGIWASATDVSFTALVAPATLTSPVDGTVGFDTTKPFTWNAVDGGDAYWLWVGTTRGGKDLVDSGSLTGTSYSAQGLPAGRTLWARLWTFEGNKQVPAGDISFTVAPTFSYPDDGAKNIDPNRPFSWTTDAQATSYRVTVGRERGGAEVLDSGPTTASSLPMQGLPAGTKLWARLTTAYASSSSTSDISFTTSPSFKYPRSGSEGIDPAQPFRWSPIAAAGDAAPTYRLRIGTAPAANDLYESSSITETEQLVPASALPTGRTLYARVAMSPGDGSTSYSDAVFTVAGSPTPSVDLTYPADGAADVDVSRPFEWTVTPMAQAYRLEISSGGSVVRDSGPIHVPGWFAEDLPTGAYSGKLSVRVDGQWHTAATHSFTVTQTGHSMAREISAAMATADFVRQMADTGNVPYPWTPLYTQTHAEGLYQALCSNFAPTLADMLGEMDVAARLPSDKQPIGLDIGFANEGHTLLQMWNSDTQSWMMLDAMFDLTMKRTSDGGWATPEEMRNATRAKDWGAIQYVFLGSSGDSFARNYFVDYPLLFLVDEASAPDPRPYMTAVAPPSSAPKQVYLIESDQRPLNVVIDGRATTLDIRANGLSQMFFARTIALPAGSTAHIQVYKPNRYVFGA